MEQQEKRARKIFNINLVKISFRISFFIIEGREEKEILRRTHVHTDH